MGNSERILLCEGNNDQHVFWNLFKEAGVPETFSVKSTGSIENVFKEIPLQLKSEHLQVLGIVIDADQNVEQRWRKIKRILEKHDICMPDTPPEDGWSEDTDLVRVGLWLMPDNKIRGNLEDFVSLLIDENDELKGQANEVLNSIEKADLARYKPKDRSKAFINTWLAWQKSPGLPMGVAIKAKYLDAQKAEAQVFLGWVRKLFSN